ncbi:MAG TPA: hypothetical protein VKT77_09295 [Chthonomonadaceae bacterium]|nr:hypothetical protein [Chthonomonadaceae bacterium]
MNFFATLPARSCRIARAALLAAALAASGALARPAAAQDAKAVAPDDVSMVKRVFKTGDVNHYRVELKANIGGVDQTVSLQFKETTKDAKPSGEFTLVNQFESASIGGMDILQAVPIVTVMRDTAGKLSNKTEGGLDAVASQISGLMEGISTLQDAYVPKTHVKMGDKWSVLVTTSSQGGSPTKSKGEATLVGTEIVGGVKSLRLKVTSDVDNKDADVKAHSDSVLNVDPATGKLLKMVAKVDGMAGGMKLVQEMELSLVPPDKATAASGGK